jgi:hypothetical protein
MQDGYDILFGGFCSILSIYAYVHSLGSLPGSFWQYKWSIISCGMLATDVYTYQLGLVIKIFKFNK